MDNFQIQLKASNILRRFVFVVYGLTLILLVGCETTKPPAPVVERTVTPGKIADGLSDTQQADRYYIVQKGDTFYSIALNHGIDQRELAQWNNITDPTNIKPGQRINLSVPSNKAEPALFAIPQQTEMPAADPSLDLPGDTIGSTVAPVYDASAQKIKTHPKALKLPYSEQNVARLQYSVNPALNLPQTEHSPTGTRIENAPKYAEYTTETASNTPGVSWIWPATGTLLSPFSNNSKGLKISGQEGQPILATAAGEVVYSGNGLRGYGNLIIIKHDEALLSAYAHNSKLLVKEGETVVQGQKIAEMGNTDADTPQLHFEIRRHGKPVDPLEFLSANPQ
ncbi:peptidoglycan DD-metalloendopeptidase family protein [Nitrosomonas sp.]|uniref:peptidoglycan DD-metalloendopeptidase family protein n=1 Tax=Nitrosomonas sp. TaxID=42353 RepID=UPI0028521DA2|nr:peptidoglycan DD-metalloendopeptidase family protein [Nitrosomonas sp.]MDR4513066.1 peptidoglycan DD-metalloendopeptidase family protein [Nitrosomonas sp.]